MYAPKTPNPCGGGARDVAAALRPRSVRPASVPAAASRLARRRSASRRASSAMVRVPADRSTTRASRFSISAYARTSRRSDDDPSTSAATRSRDAFARPTPPPPSKPSSKGLSKPSYKGLSFAFEGPGTRASRARTRVSSSPPALSGRASPRIRASTLRGGFRRGLFRRLGFGFGRLGRLARCRRRGRVPSKKVTHGHHARVYRRPRSFPFPVRRRFPQRSRVRRLRRESRVSFVVPRRLRSERVLSRRGVHLHDAAVRDATHLFPLRDDFDLTRDGRRPCFRGRAWRPTPPAYEDANVEGSASTKRSSGGRRSSSVEGHTHTAY